MVQSLPRWCGVHARWYLSPVLVNSYVRDAYLLERCTLVGYFVGDLHPTSNMLLDGSVSTYNTHILTVFLEWMQVRFFVPLEMFSTRTSIYSYDEDDHY